MTIERDRAEWLFARGWREWCHLGVVAVVVAVALAVGPHFVKVVVAAYCVGLMAAKMWGDPRWRCGWRVRYAVAGVTFILVGLAADLPLYVFPLVCVPAGWACAAVERREEKRIEQLTPSERQPT